MSGEWRKRRKRTWFDMFVEFKEIEKIVDEMISKSSVRANGLGLTSTDSRSL